MGSRSAELKPEHHFNVGALMLKMFMILGEDTGWECLTKLALQVPSSKYPAHKFSGTPPPAPTLWTDSGQSLQYSCTPLAL